MIVALCVLGTVPAARATSEVRHRYLTDVTLSIEEYRGVLKRLDRILGERPIVNVDPKVAKLNKVADLLDALAVRWSVIDAPAGLKVRHQGMERAFELQAQGWRIYAAALFTRHPEEMQTATARLGARLRSAAYLQKRWAAALRGAVIRAGTRIPEWLRTMATGGP